MKNLFILFAVLLFVACNKTNEYHLTQCTYPGVDQAILFADQTQDSIVFYSTETWTLTSNASWLQIDDSCGGVFDKPIPGYIIHFPIKLKVDINTTGAPRTALLTLRDGYYSDPFAASYLQLPFLDIRRPLRYVSDDYTRDSLTVLTNPSTAARDSVAFRSFDSWTLVPKDGSWMTIEKTSGDAGFHIIGLNLAANNTNQDRRDTLIYSTAGLCDTIYVLQRAPKLD